MTWLSYSLIGALCTATTQTLVKVSLRRGTALGACQTAMTAGPALIVVWLVAANGWDWCLSHGLGSQAFWWYQLLGLGLNGASFYFSLRALRCADATFLASTTGVNALAISLPPIILLGEVPTLGTWLGLALVALATMVLATATGSDGRAHDNRRALAYFAASLPFYACSPSVQKLGLRYGEPALSFGVSMALLSLVCMLPLLWRPAARPAPPPASRVWPLAGICLATTLGGIVTNQAMLLTSVANAMTAKKLSPVFFFIAGVVLFHERDALARRALALVVMVAGVVCMALY